MKAITMMTWKCSPSSASEYLYESLAPKAFLTHLSQLRAQEVLSSPTTCFAQIL